MPTSLVTGGAGFLGSHLCEYLLEQGHRVICVDNLIVSTLENIEHLRDDGFAFRNHDMIDPLFVDEEIDYLFHLAALASPIDYLRMPLHSLKTGSYGTHHALGLAKFKRSRFLLASTSEVYGDPEVHPQPESYWGNVNPIGPRGVYDEAKRYAEAMTMAYHGQQGVDTSIARIFNTYGPRMRPYDGRAIHVHPPVAGQQTADGVRRRVADEELLLRRRPDPRSVHARRERRAPATDLGNPGEFTILELAEAVIRVSGSESKIVYEALPIDDPQVRQPDITRAREVLGWEPEIDLEGVYEECWCHSVVSRRLFKVVALVIGLLFVAVGVGAATSPLGPTAPTSRALQLGVYDDSEVFGHPSRAFPALKALHAQVLRANLRWGGAPLSVATKRPENGTDPDDPAYNWGPFDEMVKRAADADVKVLATIVGTPGWANGGKPRYIPPKNANDLRAFATAAAKRYSGDFTPAGREDPLPAIRLWLAWNEPNNPVFIRPQWKRQGKRYVVASAAIYAKLCNAVWAGIHSTRISGEKVACGATAPRGNNQARNPPVGDARRLPERAQEGRRALRRLRAPPVLQRPERDARDPPKPRGSGAVTMGNIGDLLAQLKHLYGGKHIWSPSTATRRSRPTASTASRTRSRRSTWRRPSMVRKNPRIDMLIWFLLRDDRRVAQGWQSGLITSGGKRKPAFATFRRLARHH